MQGWKAFFEEPIMLIAFVLLGRNLEQRAKIKATSDMTGLLNMLPSKARLLVNNEETEVPSVVEVPSDSLSVEDQIIVLPGVSNIRIYVCYQIQHCHCFTHFWHLKKLQFCIILEKANFHLHIFG